MRHSQKGENVESKEDRSEVGRRSLMKALGVTAVGIGMAQPVEAGSNPSIQVREKTGDEKVKLKKQAINSTQFRLLDKYIAETYPLTIPTSSVKVFEIMDSEEPVSNVVSFFPKFPHQSAPVSWTNIAIGVRGGKVTTGESMLTNMEGRVPAKFTTITSSSSGEIQRTKSTLDPAYIFDERAGHSPVIPPAIDAIDAAYRAYQDVGPNCGSAALSMFAHQQAKIDAKFRQTAAALVMYYLHEFGPARSPEIAAEKLGP